MENCCINGIIKFSFIASQIKQILSYLSLPVATPCWSAITRSNSSESSGFSEYDRS